MKRGIIFQGAEAVIIKKSNSIIKDRIKKSYRIPFFDNKLRKQRTKRESKLLEKASKLIPIPKLIKISEYKLELEFIKGKKLSEHLDNLKNANQICIQIGKNIAKLHDDNIIHGDLTTSNMIYAGKFSKNHKLSVSDTYPKSTLRDNNLSNDSKFKIFFIDFGLGFESSHVEDKAVDLHLIKQALEAKHFKHFQVFFSNIIKGYKTSSNAPVVLQRLEKVESRGRYKEQ